MCLKLSLSLALSRSARAIFRLRISIHKVCICKIQEIVGCWSELSLRLSSNAWTCVCVTVKIVNGAETVTMIMEKRIVKGVSSQVNIERVWWSICIDSMRELTLTGWLWLGFEATFVQMCSKWIVLWAQIMTWIMIFKQMLFFSHSLKSHNLRHFECWISRL